jgi:hypothetical protein
MHLPSDILSRIKDLARHRSNGLRGGFRAVLRQWLFLLSLGVVLVIAVSGYAAFRFYYWSNLEAYLSEEEVSTSRFDQDALDQILRKFEERAAKREAIIKEINFVATTTPVVPTATSTEE